MAGLTTQMGSGAPLTKEEMIKRVQGRAGRYGQTIAESGLNDLIKDGLVPKPVRMRNAGRKPTYTYSCRAYRRVLQILRLRQRGIVGRDGQRIMLFLDGQIELTNDLRMAVSREYNKSAKALQSKIRSSYTENSREIPTKHKEKLIESFGELNQTFEQASLFLSADQRISAIRTAKNPLASTDVISMARKSITKGAPFDVSSLMPLFSGMLLLDGDKGDVSKSLDSIENLIKFSNDADFLAARLLFQFINFPAGAAAAQMIFPGTTPDTYAIATGLVSKAAKHDPALAALILVMGLKLSASGASTQLLQGLKGPSDSK